MTETSISPLKQNQNNLIYFPGVSIPTHTDDSRPPNRTKVYANGTVDPITNPDDIALIKNELLNATGKYGLRNYTIFTLAINVGLRCGDLIRLRVGEFFNEAGDFKDTDTITKESKTGKLKRYKLREGVKVVLKQYYDSLDSPTLNQYLFPSQKAPHNNTPFILNVNYELERNPKYIEPDTTGKTHITRNSFGNILNNEIQSRLKDQFSKPINLNTHSQRKTFARTYYDWAVQQDRKQNSNSTACEQQALVYLMYLLNHSSLTQTIKYLGIQNEAMMEAYDKMEAL